MRLKNAKLYKQEGQWDIDIKDGYIQHITQSDNDYETDEKETIDLEGRIV